MAKDKTNKAFRFRVNAKDTVAAVNIISSNKDKIDGKMNWRDIQKFIRSFDENNSCGATTINEICHGLDMDIEPLLDVLPTVKRVAILEEKVDKLYKILAETTITKE